ncbi:MAG: hypothetical protein M3367_02920 [Acidobacteriota bacterium]|nr:hypothetical protein [Acidobacteriota bacterium]
MKILLLLVLIFAFCLNTYNQTTKKSCELVLKDAPVLRGLKLGMSEREVLSFFGVERIGELVIFTTDRQVDYGYETITVSKEVFKKREEFRKVDKLKISLFNKKLFQIDIRYLQDEVRFENPKQFAENLSSNFTLPLQAWNYSENDTFSGNLLCKEFELKISPVFNEIILTDLITKNSIANQEEQKRKKFKP